MPRFIYKAKDKDLKFIEGSIEADNENAAISRLSELGVYPISLRESSMHLYQKKSHRRRVPSRSLAYMSRQLADLLGGGLSLFNALSLVSSQTENHHLRKALLDISGLVREGSSFADALSRHPEIFSPLYISLIKVGEAGGGLEAVLSRLADLTESEAELKSRALFSLIYPCVVLGIGLVTILVLVTFVVPKLSMLFSETGGLLPLPTRILIAISESISDWWFIWTLAIVLVVFVMERIINSCSGRSFFDRILLKTPGIGSLIRKYQTTQFARSLGVMVGQGVPILQALEISGSTLSNSILNSAVKKSTEDVRRGKSLAVSLSDSGEFPVFVSNMISVGEESGKLDGALIKVSASYERETERAMRALTTVLEPVLIVAVGVVVMFIVISMLLPIFQLGFVAQ